MIPKVIHYCWFGNGKLPELAIKCIDSWKKFLPEYELRLWNEKNFDISSNRYVSEAYHSKKYAFVTDFVRLYALYNFGGIYMDTDVEVLKSLDDILNIPAFSGYESNKYSNFPTGIMASKAKGIWVTEQLEYYNDAQFIRSDGTFDLTTNTQIISRIMQKNGFILNGKYCIYKNDMHCFPSDYFCPKTSTGVLKITENTYCIHHFAGSWYTPSAMSKFKNQIKKLFGVNFVDKIVQIKRYLLKNG